jgi:hypothetical protein
LSILAPNVNRAIKMAIIIGIGMACCEAVGFIPFHITNIGRFLVLCNT